MITLEKQKSGLELVNKLIEKSYESSSFKNELLNSPYTAIESVYGSPISKKMNIVVEDQSNSDFIYLNIPVKPNLETMELSDEQLEMVSGGEILASVGVAAIIITAGAVGAVVGYAICKAIN